MSQSISQTEKASFQLFSVPFHLQCDNLTPQIKVKPKPPTLTATKQRLSHTA